MTTTAPTNADRRRHVRELVDRPCKLFHRPSLRFWAGRTTDLSDGGALLSFESPRAPEPGDAIDVVIAWSDRPVLPGDSLVRSEVVRVGDAKGDRHQVAVRFDRPLSARARAA